MTIPHINGLAEIADRYDFFFLDIYGLLHNGLRINPGTIDCLTQLKAMGKKTCLVSNTPRRAHEAAEDQSRHGITRDLFSEAVTAGESARVELNEKYAGRKVFFLGSDYFTGPLEGLNILKVPRLADADFILNSIPGTFDLHESQITALLHEAHEYNLPMICANPDLVVHIGDVLHTCAGTYAALYEHIGGTVSYHGKPYGQIYDMARALVGNPPKDRICALGDALHTDIRGANAYGIDSAWCLSGIHWEELRYHHQPEHPDPAVVTETLSKSDHKPRYTLTHFAW